MPALVAIDLPPATSADLVSAAIATCSAALGEGSCVVADEETAPRYLAVVRWGGADGTNLRVELWRGTAEGTTLDTRLISFAPADRERQRWASAGLVVAALVVQRESGEASPPPRVEKPRALPRPASPQLVPKEGGGEPEPPPREKEGWLLLDVAGVAGPAFDDDSIRAGPALRATWAPAALPLAPFFGVRSVVRPGLPSGTWLGGDLGGVVRFGGWTAGLAADVRFAATGERIIVVANDPKNGAREAAGRWRVGGRLGVEVGCRLRAPAGILFGGELSILRPEVQIEVEDELMAVDSFVGSAVWVGLRVTIADG